jgi:hypothetical protein
MLTKALFVLMAIGMVAPAVGYAGDPGGYDSARIENEYMLVVPPGKAEEVWQYLNARYNNEGAFMRNLGPDFNTKFSVEQFADDYFDDPELHVLEMQSGIRHRTRNITSDPSDRKNGRELIQMKLNRPGDQDALDRTEMKFPLGQRNEIGKSPWASHPVIGLIEEKYQREFMDRVKERGIDPLSLRKTLTVKQRRRRAYVSYKGQAFITMTIDEAASQFWWKTARLNQLELELNEIGYTVASPAQRKYMKQVNDGFLKDLYAKFPYLKQDQGPKYNKVYDGLAKQYLWFPVALRIGVPVELVFGGLASALLLGLGVMGVRFRRRRLASPTAPGFQAGKA